MKTAAIICEFNPIHHGHKYILTKAREAAGDDGAVICVMSGSLTQRAAPAVYDKYTRAAAAIAEDADLVLELPFPWCSSGAEQFALGGVTIASAVGADDLIFGSESGNLTSIEQTAQIKQTPAFTDTIRTLEKTCPTTGSAELYAKALAQSGINIAMGPNDRLAAEYIRYGKQSGIRTYTAVKRLDTCKSASEIRQLMKEPESIANLIPKEAAEILKSKQPLPESAYSNLLFTYARLFLRDSINPILRYAAKTAANSHTADEFARDLPQKKYTTARIRRELLFSLLNAPPEPASPPAFTVLLAATKKGREYLKSVKKSTSIEIITKPADNPKDPAAKAQYALHLSSDRLYSYLIGEKSDFFVKSSPVIT